MSKWLLNGRPLEEPPDEEDYGYLYKITNIATGEYYWGMKSFWSITNPKLSKKKSLELWSGRGAKPKRQRGLKKQSNWREYISSSTTLKQMILEQGIEAFRWEIISIHKDKAQLQVAEALAILDSFCDPLSKNGWLKLTIYKNNYCK